MSAVLEITKPKITKSEVLYGVSWEMYEELVTENSGFQCPRLSYDSGVLEINMSNSSDHEENTYILTKIVETILVELEIDWRNFGSTTYTRENIRKGFEPDTCFYIQSLKKIEGKSNLGIKNVIPPDLIIEINKTSSSVPRMPIFAAFGVSEVWRFAGKTVNFYVLSEGVYLETKNSLAIPILTSAKATELLLASRQSGSTAWIKNIRQWTAGEMLKGEG